MTVNLLLKIGGAVALGLTLVDVISAGIGRLVTALAAVY